MNKPSFFVPGIDPEKQEEVLGLFAKEIKSVIPPFDKRVYSITFKHNGEEWTATVGEKLYGTGRKTVHVRGKKTEISYPLSDQATVLAIISGQPCYTVFLSSGRTDSARTQWANPFIVGTHDIRNIVMFST